MDVINLFFTICSKKKSKPFTSQLGNRRLAAAAPFLPAAGETEQSQAGTGGGEEPAQAGHELDDPASG